MDLLNKIYSFLTSGNAQQILTAVLTIIGALRVLAQYTPLKGDDKLFATIEAPVNWVLSKIGGSK